LERFEKLFRESERIRPPAGMWESIAARAGMALKAGKVGKAGERGAPIARETGWGWKMAASLAVGIGVLSALLVVMKPAPEVADKAGGAEDFAVARAAVSPLPDEDDLYWHADLGEESGMDWVEEEDALLLDAAAADATDE